MRKNFAVIAMVAGIAAVAAAGPAPAGKASLNLVLVIDGLRPDSITAQETPNLWRLREEGVNFPNGHAVFPTVTRANAAAMGTGKVSLQDVAVPGAGGVDDVWMGVAFLADGSGTEMGIAGDCDGRGGVFDLGEREEAVAVWRESFK